MIRTPVQDLYLRPSQLCFVLTQGATHWNAGLQPLLHAHVVQEDEALERQSEGSARSTLCSADKRREVGKGLSLADTQTGR